MDSKTPISRCTALPISTARAPAIIISITLSAVEIPPHPMMGILQAS